MTGNLNDHKNETFEEYYNRTTITEEPISTLPDECQQCGCNCSKTERTICLSEMNGV